MTSLEFVALWAWHNLAPYFGLLVLIIGLGYWTAPKPKPPAKPKHWRDL